MLDCANLIHPFQNDPGVSQRQRIMDDLLSGSAKIDGRNMADLLDYFVQLSRHVNYYDKDLNISDWQPFFQKSIPFSLAAIIKYDRAGFSQNIDAYNKLFDKRPSKTGIQLLLHYLFHRIINPLNKWHLQSKGSGLPVELILEKLIRDKLRIPLAKFVCYHNAAVQWYCVKPLDFLHLSENEAWNLDLSKDAGDCHPKGKTRRARLIALRNSVKDLAPIFLDVIRIIADVAAQSMEQSLFPLKEELQEKHTPHLALLFAFLKLFQHLQADLNKFTRKHLDFFYKQVLKIKSRDAIPDKVHLVFEIQKQLDRYLFEKGLLVKDGKDINKAEILFALDDEIVVNKTQVAEKRTLFVNNQDLVNETYVEGVYMAPNADKADGLQQDFPDGLPKSFTTLGAKYSKYKDPEKTSVNAYPNARLGFILASPVLLLNEGKRNITITLLCQLDVSCVGNDPKSFSAALLYPKVRKLAAKGFYYISQELIAEAAKKGITDTTLAKLWLFLLEETREGCCGTETVYNADAMITARNWRVKFYNTLTDSEKTVLSELFRQRRIFKIFFSGKEEWIEPSNIRRIRFSTLDTVTNQFTIRIKTRLKADKPAVTFYDKLKLKEDFNTTQPLVKVELDDDIKIFRGFDVPKTSCCLQIKPGNEKRNVSFYHFFRSVIILGKTAARETKIDVRVCGLRNFVVQNDESVQDVNGPVYPFGTRPEIVDFDLVNPANPPLANPNLTGPSFYIGSKEVFGKKWNEIYVNLKWKDKPSDFNEYYLGYWADPTLPPAVPPPGFKQKYGLDKSKFEINLSVLQDGKWKKELKHPDPSPGGPPPPHPAETALENPVTHDKNRRLFPELNLASSCVPVNPFDQTIYLKTEFFEGLASQFNISNESFGKYDVNSRHGFLKINLQNQDFLHKDYAFALARQMMALGKYPDALLEGAVYREQGGTVVVFKNFGLGLIILRGNITDTKTAAEGVKTKAKDTYDTFNAAAAYVPPASVFPPVPPNPEAPPSLVPFPPPPSPFPLNTISDGERDALIFKIRDTYSLAYALNSKAFQTLASLEFLEKIYSFFDPSGKVVRPLNIPIPNEPWTPIIKNITLDYTATATATDIDLIHLYPYKDTYKQEEIELKPTLIPAYCDEGTLFIGLKDLVPGSNVNMLFQLAEATADSESDYEEVAWHYLDSNQWKPLREGFEVLDDATDGLTTSGIVKFALPANMTRDNTILPRDLHWIRASVPKNSRTVSETIAIYTQAIRATFTNDATNDKLRLGQPLVAGSISRLNEANANLKKLAQPYDTFGGRVPEVEGHFYVRVSEILRHKGRAIQKFDYERLVLEMFPQLFKAKCINHSFALNGYKYKNDFPIAPGYVLLVVIPDLKQLKAAQSFEPRVPVSMLDDIEEQLKRLTSPFVRLRAMNPRYEKIHFCLTIKLVLGKDENYYKEKLKQDLREFLAPWSIGHYEKLTFGQCVSRSEVVRFLETRDYVDYILELLMRHNDDNWPDKTKGEELNPICPKTPRSILIAGDIDVCIPTNDCEAWQPDTTCENKKIPISDYCLRGIPG